MIGKNIIDLPVELLGTISTDKKLRNAIVEAFQTKEYGNTCLKANLWPQPYRVTEAHVEVAKAEKERDRSEIITSNLDNIVFTGMGMIIDNVRPGNINNYRFRANLVNREGRNFFIEFTTAIIGPLRCTYAMDEDLRKRCEAVKMQAQPYYNFKNLQKMEVWHATMETVLNIVNKTFDCNFKKAIIDNYTVVTEDCPNVSPK